MFLLIVDDILLYQVHKAYDTLWRFHTAKNTMEQFSGSHFMKMGYLYHLLQVYQQLLVGWLVDADTFLLPT